LIDEEGTQLGVVATTEALKMARKLQVDLVEIAAAAKPPVCRLVNYGKYRYEKAKKEKETKKTTHINKVKEVQLRPNIGGHDFDYKLHHAAQFLCEDMKVKVTLRFRGRENAHREIGFETVTRFGAEIGKWGTPDASPKLVGRGIVLMISPLSKDKRAEPPSHLSDHAPEDEEPLPEEDEEVVEESEAEAEV
jgi:translation initiation factor IF-3